MSAHGERVLVAHLADPESLQTLVNEGLDLDMVPSAEARLVVRWAMDYYYQSGCRMAPSVTVLRQEFGDLLDDAEFDIEHEPEDSIDWAVADLKATWVHQQATNFNKVFATAMASAPKDERPEVISTAASALVSVALSLEPRSRRVDMRGSSGDLIRAYEEREATKGTFDGMGFGLPEVDENFYGFRPGELVVAAAGPKVGKSFFQCYVALSEWRRGRTVCLFTLENSVEMMLNRIACMAMAVDGQAWDRGEATEFEVERVKEFLALIAQSETPLWVLQPDMGQRSFEHMVREAQLRGADTLLIDQLTFVEVGSGDSDRRSRHEKIGHSLHNLKVMISTGRHRLSTLLTHQVNREGIKRADKTGRLEIYDMAEAAEVERTADHVFGLYQSSDARSMQQVMLQTLGSRRVAGKDWMLDWRLGTGTIRVRNEITL